MRESGFPHEDLTGKIIGAAIKVHRTLDCGFLESAYEEAPAIEFGLCNVSSERQKSLDVFLQGACSIIELLKGHELESGSTAEFWCTFAAMQKSNQLTGEICGYAD